MRRWRVGTIEMKFLLALWVGGAVFCGRANAQRWERLGPEGGLVVSLGTGPGRSVYLGAADGHVFYSGDGARSWELRGRVGGRLDAVVTRLVSDPQTGERLYAAVWYQTASGGGGVFRSEDGGRSWTLLGLEKETVRALEVAPSQRNELIAGTRSGVFRSRDGGKNWERISPPDDAELRNVDSLAIDPQNPELIYVGTYHLPWKTEDGGKSWKPVIAGIIDDSDVMSIRIDATNPARLFMSACSGIYRSENSGAEWVKLQGIPYSARRTQSIVQDPANANTLFAGTTEGLWVTRDGGESWTRTTGKDWVVNSVVVVPGSAAGTERVVLGTDGRGVQVSDDGGVHFSEANSGFTHTIVDSLAADKSIDGHFLAVLERADGRLLETRDAGKSWTPVVLSRVARGTPTPLSEDQIVRVYATPWGWLVRMADGQYWLRNDKTGVWREWNLRLVFARSSGKAKTIGSARIDRAEVQSPMQDTVVVSAPLGLLRCAESGVCTSMRVFGRGGPVRAVWASQNSAQLAVVRDNKLALSSNGGDSAEWRDLPVRDERVLWVDVEDGEGNQTLFLGTTQGLYTSRGANGAWIHVSEGLPEGSVVRWLRGEKGWVAAERGGGLYFSAGQGLSWDRVEGDAERGEFIGLVWAGPRTVLAGSRSEGLLRVVLP